MANQTGADLETTLLDNLQINVTTDPPIATVASAGTVAASKTYPLINDAYATLYELWGGTLKRAASNTLWTPSPSNDTSGFAVSLIAMSEIVHLFSTTTAPQSMSTTTNATTLITSAAGFGTITVGMLITGTGIPAETFVAKVTDSSNITMTQAATDSTTTSRTFSPVSSTNELEPTDLAEIEFLRANASSIGTYTVPKKYAASMVATTTAANVGFLRIDYWPGITSLYFPAHYIPPFTPMTAATDVPDLPDIAQRDVAHLAALNAADLIGRPEFKAAIQKKLSERTQLLLARKQSAMVEARQDK